LSLAQGLNSALPNPRVQGIMEMKRVREGGPRLENRMVSASWVFNRSFHVQKYLSKLVTAWLSLQEVVSGRQD
jgi:hypothetical protein